MKHLGAALTFRAVHIQRLHRVLLVLFVIAAFVFPQPFIAQEPPPDYLIRAEQPRLSADGSEIVIPFTVYNSGGRSLVQATVVLLDTGNETEIARVEIRPLNGSGDNVQAELRFPVTTFPPGTERVLRLEVGAGEIEANSARTFFDNRDDVIVRIPDATPVEQAPPTSPPPQTSPETVTEEAWPVITVPGTSIIIDLNDPDDRLALAGIVASSLLALVFLLLIVRLFTQRRPAFGNWQPAYATTAPLEPHSVAARRHQWQQIAQNNLIPEPCQEASLAARKVLLGMDGYYLSGWQMRALRMMQYDMYGRVARSQVSATKSQLNRLNRLARRSATLAPQQVERRTQRTARSLAKQFRAQVTKRSAMLPVALDVQFRGTHGEVRILFELHQCQHGQYQQLDTWEPEMIVVGRHIQEAYTYTIFGQTQAETYRDFKRRIQADISRVLVSMVGTAPTPQQQPAPSTQRVEPASFPVNGLHTAPTGRSEPAPPTSPNLTPVSDEVAPDSEDNV